MTITSSTKVPPSSERLQVGFVPFITSNSYQEQLILQLAKLGINVCKLDGDSYFLPAVAWEMKLDLVHIHWLDTFYWGKSTFRSYLKLSIFISGLILLKLTGIKIVWTVHNLKRHESLHPRLERICTAAIAKFSNKLIVHCDIAKEKILESFSFLSSDKVVVIPHGNYIGQYSNTISQEEARQSLNISNSSFVFLFLGQIRPYKGVLSLIDSFKEFNKAEDLILMIAGKVVKSSMREAIQKHVGDFNNIYLHLENVEDDEIQLYMNCADIIVFPYKDVLTSGAVILAMSFSKPCIASKVGCIENTLDSSGAYLYEADDDNGLLRAMKAALSERTQMSAMGQNNYVTVKQWDWSTLAKETHNVYLDSAGKR
jgi:beta-1,4-mannosyltransferase